jgi:hypothetical protein
MLEMVESIWCAGVVPTIDRATSAWRSSRCVRQHSLRCTTAHRCCLVGRPQLLHIDDAVWRGVHFRHRCHRPCTVASPSYAPTLPSMCHYSLLSYGRTSADVGQCRLVEARGAVSTIDLAVRARWRRRRLRQGCLRCISTRCRRLAGRAQMSDNVDSSRRAVDYRPSTSLPVHDRAAVVCANVAYDVPVLAVVEWRTAHRFWTMSTRRGARCSVDHRPRCSCTVAPPSCAPRLPTMYQCSLLLFSGTRADVGQYRLVEARDAVSTSDLSVSVRRFRGTIEMHDCTYVCIK